MKLIKKKKKKKPRYAETSVAIGSVSRAQLWCRGIYNRHVRTCLNSNPMVAPTRLADLWPAAGETHAWCDLTTL